MNSSKLIKVIVTTLFFSSTSLFASANEFETGLLDIQKQWAKVNYTLKDDAQESAFEALIIQAKEFVKKNPSKAEPLVWYGIIESSYAGASGGLGALSHAKLAKKAFESAIQLDEKALNGSAYTSLGVLYHKVPGWPIAFGDDDDAKELLEKALHLNPDGIDSNYFYAEFLFDEKEYDKAKLYVEKAQSAAPRESRPLADKSRRAEVAALLNKINRKL